MPLPTGVFSVTSFYPFSPLCSQVEGFPSPDEVRTFYVEHNIDGSEEDTSVLQFILDDKRILAEEPEIRETLTSVGFSDERRLSVVSLVVGR